MCKLKILATSDLHGYMPDIPPCDILILAGDHCPYHNLKDQVQWFNGIYARWLRSLPARFIVAVAGNHDFALQNAPQAIVGLPWTILEDSSTVIEGLRFYGTPWTPAFGRWAFMESEDRLRQRFADIPEGLDFLISHGPPQGVCDMNGIHQPCGSSALRYRIEQCRPRYVVSGHIHEAHGLGYLNTQHGLPKATVVYNVSYVDLAYQPVNPIIEIKMS